MQIIVSVISSVAFIYAAEPSIAQLVVNLVNIGAAVLARQHIANFWKAKSKVPFVEGYNKGVEQSKLVRLLLEYLAMSWIVTTTVTGLSLAVT